MIPPEDFALPDRLALRRRDHERIDGILAARVAEEDLALERAGGRRTWSDRALAPANRMASRLFLRESRRKVWANAHALNRARLAGPTPMPAGSSSSRRPPRPGWRTCCAAVPSCSASPSAASA